MLDRGYGVVALDNLVNGHRSLVDPRANFVEGDVADATLLSPLMTQYAIDAVVHLAGFIEVGDSVKQPLAYYRNNSYSAQVLIEACVRASIRFFLFSSTASVYGIPSEIPIREETPRRPVNPYGRSKLFVEWLLEDTAAVEDFHYTALRYFNVAGADAAGRSGQLSRNATHLIKIASEVLCGARDSMSIFGGDYPTPDGTCIRDYIHVSDLAEIHVGALSQLMDGCGLSAMNCGYGHGYSVQEVLSTMEAIAGRAIGATPSARRAGDPPILVADNTKLRAHLDWVPRCDDLATICSSALAWEHRSRGLSDGD